MKNFEYKTILCTPEMATEMLTHNIRNRSINKSDVKRIAERIQSGQWEFDGSPIKFNSDGILVDGHHRLAAIVKAGIPVELAVVYGVDSQWTDTGRKRSSRDSIFINYPDLDWVDTNATSSLEFLNQFCPELQCAEHPEKAAFFRQHAEKLRDILPKLCKTRGVTGSMRCAGFRAAFMVAAMDDVPMSVLDRALHILFSGAGDGGVDHTIDYLRENLRKMDGSYKKKSFPVNREIFLKSCYALKKFSEGVELSSARTPNEGPFYIFNAYGEPVYTPSKKRQRKPTASVRTTLNGQLELPELKREKKPHDNLVVGSIIQHRSFGRGVVTSTSLTSRGGEVVNVRFPDKDCTIGVKYCLEHGIIQIL